MLELTRRCEGIAATCELSYKFYHVSRGLESTSILLNSALLQFLIAAPICAACTDASSHRLSRINMFLGVSALATAP